MKKFIITLLTVVTVFSLIFAGCAPAKTPEGTETPETPELPSEPEEQSQKTPEQPSEVPEEPTTVLPKSGVWNASTGATEFIFNFTVNSDGTGISQYTHEFTEFGYCGGYRVGKMTSEVSLGEPIPINPLPSGAEFSLVDDKQVYSGQEEDPLRGIPGWIHIYWHIVIEGQFDETGTHASGTWAISSTGKEHSLSPISSPPSSEGTICQEGTWEASPS